jgi:heme/copper-type cytochrome/quinol oxidase subunit 2
MVARLREMISGPASTALVLLMLAGCLLLWLGVPLGWLWIGSQVQSSASLGTAMMVTMLGITGTVLGVVTVLSWLNRRHAELQERRNRPPGRSTALEVILVISAVIAVVVFGIWFFGFAGASPVPLNIGF